MVDISPLQSLADLHKPRRITKYVLIWCASGSVTVIIDGHEFQLTANTLITITSGQYHFIKEMMDATGYVLEFTYAFFCQDDQDIELIFHNGLFCHFDQNEVIALPPESMVGEQLARIEQELQQKLYQHLLSVHARIELSLVAINRAKIGAGHEIWKPDALYLKFLDNVRANFAHHYSLAAIADQLNTTPLKLNEQSRLFTGKTAQMVIYGLMVSEARRLLMYENQSIKETAFQLGFSDPFYFSNFFKKHTGQSPKAYKELLAA